MPGCSGAVTADGTCYFVRPTLPSAGIANPMLTARTPVGDAWSVTDLGYRWYPELDVPPVVVRDDSGMLYAGLGFGTEVSSGVVRRGRLISINPVTRAIAWTRPDLPAVLVALRSGVLAVREGGIVSVGPDGADRWSRALAPKDLVWPATTAYDATRDRLYLGRTTGVTALVASTGVQVWRTRPSDRAELLSVGRSGRVYVSIGASARRGVRALRLTDGSTAWQRRTRLPVRDALELADGSVVVSAGTSYPTTAVDRLTRLRPR
jgi:outer membrane protein assembly factor BamB